MTTAIAEQDPKAQELQAQVASLAPLPVTSPETYEAAGLNWKAIVAMEKEVNDYWDPLVTAAHKTHKALTAKRAEFLEPLAKAKADQTRLMKTWAQEEERKRQEAERIANERARQEAERLAKEAAAKAKKEAEERALADAVALEEAGFKEEATKVLQEAPAAAPIPAPVPVAQIVQPRTVPKGFGAATKTTWKAQVTDMRALLTAILAGQVPMGAVAANESFLNAQAKLLQKEMAWPGVRAWEE